MRLAILKERRGHRPRLQPRVPAESSGCKAQPLRGGEYRRLNPFDRHLVHHDVDDRTVTRFARLGRDERSEEHTSELQSHSDIVCRLLLEKKNFTPMPK